MKAIFFLGRIHHGLKLMYLANRMTQLGIEVEVLVSDNAINIDPPTEFIHKLGIPTYNHVKDYIEPRHIPEIEKIVEELAFTALDVAEAGVSPFWTMFSIREMAENLAGMENFLGMSQAPMVFALHENNFWAKMLFYLAQRQGMRTYSLMEGIILEREEEDMGKYSIGTEYTDVLFSWSQDDKKYYQDPDRIYASGPPHMDEWISLTSNPMKHIEYKYGFRNSLGIHAPVVTFMPPRLDLYAGDFFKHLAHLADWSSNTGVGLVLRLHPFQGSIGEIKKVLNRYPHVKLVEGPDGMPSIAGSDLIITQTSTVAIEALAIGTPVVQIDLDYVGLEQPLDVAMQWSDGDTGVLERVLRGYWDVSAADRFRREELGLFDGGATERIIEHVRRAD